MVPYFKISNGSKWLAIAFSLLLLAAAPALAGTVTLNWDPVPDTDLAGYKIYYGTSSNNYPNVVDVGNVTSYTLTNMADCTVFYFAVKAYDTADNHSALFSNELVGMARPTVVSTAPGTASQNSNNLDITITGTNFAANASVVFSGTGITVNSVAVQSCTTAVANISIAPSATVGDRDVTLTNSDSTMGVGTAVFAVTLADLTAPVVSNLTASGLTTSDATITWSTDEPATSQVAYRVQGTTTYQQSALSSALSTSHSVTLGGLIAGTTYEYHVMSTDGAGNTATTSPDDTFITVSYDFVTLEAESGVLNSPVVSHDDFDTPLAFGGAYIWTPENTGNNNNGNPAGKATYTFNLANSGSYTLWVRMYAATSNNGSFWQSLDGGNKTALVAGGIGSWVWTQGASWDVSAGQHTLVLGHRDEQSRADQIIVTDDPGFVPTAVPVDTTPAQISAVQSGNLTTTGATISWTTNEPTDSQVEYGTSTSYGSQTPVDSTLTLSHSIVLTGLSPSTTYHFRVISVDRGGNTTQSTDFTFTTAAEVDLTPPANVNNLRRGDTAP